MTTDNDPTNTRAEVPGPSDFRESIPYRTLGRTGEKVSIIGLGGAHVGIQPSEQESIRIIRTALDNGVNFLDNSWDYHGGRSEIRMGKALRDGYRSKAFLMTKFDGRTRESATRQIEESLRRLQTDCIDLIQFHEVIRMEDPDRIFGPGGALEAAIEAQDAGKVRYIGFTGHKSPEIHLKMLQAAARHGFRFDAVQMPLNVMDAHYDSFEKKVLPVLMKEEIGVLGMKPMGGGVILENTAVTPVECLRYAMSLPVSVVITGCDSLPVLEQALEAARGFKPMEDGEIASLLEKTAPAAQKGRLELYKTSRTFDSTYWNPEWLG
ncbi:MAG: aldo/keto reductase [Desulfomonilia bacterium]|jgi:predicted aldo/keto reductase-like oxidoreductase